MLDGAHLLGELLAACPRLTVLATSRAPLQLQGERVWQVAPLTAEDALRLFVERATAAGPEFRLTPANEPAIRAICRRLDHLPLALELAAARTPILSPPALLERLSRSLSLLTQGPRDLPPRQRTMRDAIAWSYDLLSPEEQRLFARLAVFPGGFTLEAIEAIVDGLSEGPARAAAVLAELTRLVEQNLVQSRADAQETMRFTLLDTVREFAGERLDERGETAALRHAHAVFFADWAEREHQLQEHDEQPESFERLAAEQGNLRAALAWAVEQSDRRLGLRLAAATAMFWLVRGQLREGRYWLEALPAAGIELPRATYREARYHAASFALMLGDRERARQLGEDLRATSEAAGDIRGVGRALFVLALLARAQGGEAAEQFAAALALFRQAGDERWVALALGLLGSCAIERREFGEAEAYLAEALAICDRLDHTWGTATALSALGDLARTSGDDQLAITRYRQSLSLFAQVGDRWSGADVLVGLAVSLIRAERAAAGVRLLGAAEALREEFGIPIGLGRFAAERSAVKRARAALGEARLAELWQAGRTLSFAAAASEVAAIPTLPSSKDRPERASGGGGRTRPRTAVRREAAALGDESG